MLKQIRSLVQTSISIFFSDINYIDKKIDQIILEQVKGWRFQTPTPCRKFNWSVWYTCRCFCFPTSMSCNHNVAVQLLKVKLCHLSNILLIIVLDKKTFRHESWHFISVNRKNKYTIPTPHNFAKVDFTIKWNIVSLQIDVMTFKINANRWSLLPQFRISLSSSFKF
jgi:hypothetical protein